MMQIIAILSILLISTECIHLSLQQGYTIVCNSSLNRGILSVSMSSFGRQNSSFYVQSQILSPLINRHRFTHGQTGFVFDPQLKEQLVLFNDYSSANQEYWLTLKHKLVFNQKLDVKFVGMTILDGQNTHEYLLPAFKSPYTFLPSSSMFRCDCVLIGLILYEDRVDMSLFVKQSSGVTWYDQLQKWGWNWRQNTAEYDFGRYTARYEDKDATVKLELTNGKYCQFKPREIKSQKTDRHPEHTIKKSRYLSFDQVLDNSVPLQVHQSDVIQQQL